MLRLKYTKKTSKLKSKKYKVAQSSRATIKAVAEKSSKSVKKKVRKGDAKNSVTGAESTNQSSSKLAQVFNVKNYRGDNIIDQIIADSKGKRISFLWTKNTREQAEEIVMALKSRGVRAQMLETTKKGKDMMRRVNKELINRAKKAGIDRTEIAKQVKAARFKNNTIWENAFGGENIKGWYPEDVNFKNKISEIQQDVSAEYAQSIKDDYIIETRRMNEDLVKKLKEKRKELKKKAKEEVLLGEANRVELETLEEIGRSAVDGKVIIKGK